MSRKMLVPFKFLTRASDPSTGSEGEVYFNTSDSTIRVHNGTVWVPIFGGNNDVPFYMHTHNYDGDVDSVLPTPLTVDELGNGGYLQANGGSPDSIPTSIPSKSNILDGGVVG